MSDFDWRAEVAKGAVMIDVEGAPVLGAPDGSWYKAALTGNPVRASRVMENGGIATAEEFEAMVADWESRPPLRAASS